MASAAGETQASTHRWWRLYAAALVGTVPLLALFIMAHRMPGFRLGPGDFAMFYTGATLVRETPAALYDLDTQTHVQQTLLTPYGWTYTNGLLPFNYPPFVAVLLQWIARFPLPTAYFIWLAMNIAALLALIGYTHAPSRLLFAWLLLLWPITWMVLLQGQPGIWLALFLAAGWWHWRRGHAIAAGLWWAGLAIKPQFAVLVWLWVVWQRQRRLLAGLAVGLGGLLLLTLFSTGWQSLLDWGRMLLFTAQTNGAYGIAPTLMPNVRGILFTLGIPAPWVWGVWGLAAVGMLSLLVRLWQHAPAETAFAGTVIATLLLTPHSFLHDLVLLSAIAPLVWENAAAHARTATILLLATHALAFINVFTRSPLLVSVLWGGVLCAWGWLVLKQAERTPRAAHL